MLRITVEILGANTGRRTVLGVLDIANVSRRGIDSKRGDYEGRIYKKGTADPSAWHNCGGTVVRSGKVENYPRLSYPVWRLVLRMLRNMYPEEK